MYTPANPPIVGCFCNALSSWIQYCAALWALSVDLDHSKKQSWDHFDQEIIKHIWPHGYVTHEQTRLQKCLTSLSWKLQIMTCFARPNSFTSTPWHREWLTRKHGKTYPSTELSAPSTCLRIWDMCWSGTASTHKQMAKITSKTCTMIALMLKDAGKDAAAASRAAKIACEAW